MFCHIVDMEAVKRGKWVGGFLRAVNNQGNIDWIDPFPLSSLQERGWLSSSFIATYQHH
jgi:hypothetical protein